MYNYYVTYEYEGGVGACFMNTSFLYNTKENLSSLIDYISSQFCKGKTVIITNLIKLEDAIE